MPGKVGSEYFMTQVQFQEFPIIQQLLLKSIILMALHIMFGSQKGIIQKT